MNLNSQWTQCWKIKLKKNQLKRQKKNSIKLGLTCKTNNLGHEIKITLKKQNQIKYEVQSLVYSILKDEYENKIKTNQSTASIKNTLWGDE